MGVAGDMGDEGMPSPLVGVCDLSSASIFVGVWALSGVSVFSGVFISSLSSFLGLEGLTSGAIIQAEWEEKTIKHKVRNRAEDNVCISTCLTTFHRNREEKVPKAFRLYRFVAFLQYEARLVSYATKHIISW